MRQDQVAMINAARHQQPDQVARKAVPMARVNRKLRRQKIKLVRALTPFARPIRRGPQPPAAIDSLVAIHIKNEDGKVVRRFVIPRDKLQAELLAKTRTEQKAEANELQPQS